MLYMELILTEFSPLFSSVLFLLFPEPSYSGPDEIQFFRGPALDVRNISYVKFCSNYLDQFKGADLLLKSSVHCMKLLEG